MYPLQFSYFIIIFLGNAQLIEVQSEIDMLDQQKSHLKVSIVSFYVISYNNKILFPVNTKNNVLLGQGLF